MEAEADLPPSSTPAPPIQSQTKRKIEKIISSKVHNDPEFVKVVDYVSPIVTDLDIHTERRLMRKLEQRQLHLNKEYLKELEKVNEHVQTFVEKVNGMHKICSDLTNRIQQNKEKTQHLLSKTSALQNRRKVLEAKQTAIGEFLNKFSLTADEEKALLGNEDGTITIDFFPALNRVKQIYEESKLLLRTSGNHSAAAGVMEEMNVKMEAANELLYRSIQRECRLLNTEMVEVRGVLCESFAALKDREVLLKYALDEYASARKNHVLRVFLDALTRGSHSSVKPIELLSHDPIRYTGDMLAWIYESVESERDLVTLLLRNLPTDVAKQLTPPVLAQISSALSRPFKVRVEQTLTGEHDAVLLYRLVTILSFYSSKILPEVSRECEMAIVLEELQQLTLNILFSALSSTVQKILGKMSTADYDLLPVPAVHQSLMLLKDVLDVHDSASSEGDDAKIRFDKIVGSVVEPLLRAVQLAATQLDSAVDVAVYTLNCLSAIHSLLILYPFTQKRIEVILALMEGNEDVLISEESSAILSSTSLITLYTKAVAHNANQGALSGVADAEESSVKRALDAFDEFLSHPTSCSIDQVARISNTRVRERVHSRTMENIVAAYAIIYSKLVDPSNKYAGLSPKTVQQVKELLK